MKYGTVRLILGEYLHIVCLQVNTSNSFKRLSIFGLQTLEERRLRSDLIQYYKIDKSLNKVNWYHPSMFSLSSDGQAGNLRGQNKRSFVND